MYGKGCKEVCTEVYYSSQEGKSSIRRADRGIKKQKEVDRGEVCTMQVYVKVGTLKDSKEPQAGVVEWLRGVLSKSDIEREKIILLGGGEVGR